MIRFNVFGPLFEHGSLQVNCETTNKVFQNMIRWGQFRNFLAKHHLPRACSTSISPLQKYGLERYTHTDTDTHTCDELRFLDPSYTIMIAPSGQL